jgi:hypothetical protein
MMTDIRKLIARTICAYDGCGRFNGSGCMGLSDSILAALDAAGLVVVPREPSTAMLASALPTLEPETPDDVRRGKMAVDSLPRLSASARADAIAVAGQMARDYRVMISASPYAKKETK